MPGFDGTGPRGMGPMSGRGLGYCVLSIENSSGDQAQNMSYTGRSHIRQGSYESLNRGYLPFGIRFLRPIFMARSGLRLCRPNPFFVRRGRVRRRWS